MEKLQLSMPSSAVVNLARHIKSGRHVIVLDGLVQTVDAFLDVWIVEDGTGGTPIFHPLPSTPVDGRYEFSCADGMLHIDAEARAGTLDAVFLVMSTEPVA